MAGQACSILRYREGPAKEFHPQLLRVFSKAAVYHLLGFYSHSFRFLCVALAELRRTMDLKLRVLEGKNAGHEIAVKGKKFFIGRAEDCQLRPGSDLISRHHCVLLVEEGYIAV